MQFEGHHVVFHWLYSVLLVTLRGAFSGISYAMSDLKDFIEIETTNDTLPMPNTDVVSRLTTVILNIITIIAAILAGVYIFWITKKYDLG